MANTKGKKGESSSNKKQITNEVVTREYSVNLHKRLHGVYVYFILFLILMNSILKIEHSRNVHHEQLKN
jgi:hypothetical protein